MNSIASNKHRFKSIFVTLIFLTIGQLPVIATPNGYDPTFGLKGIAYSNFRNFAYEARTTTALQSDGKILQIGYSWRPDMSYDFVVTRYLSRGRPDYSFGTNGFVYTDLINGSSDSSRDLAVQADNKILVLGQSSVTTNTGIVEKIALVRYESNGTLDNSFGKNGRVTDEITLRQCGKNRIRIFPYSLATQIDGTILAAGTLNCNAISLDKFFVIKYLQSGVRDNAFGNQGVVITDPANANGFSSSPDIIVLNDGRFLVSGKCSSPRSFVTVRYNSDGTLDNTYGTQGIAYITIKGRYTESLFDSEAQTDGKILLAGGVRTFNSFVSSASIVRVNIDGTLDTSFGNNGLVLMGSTGDGGYINKVKFQPNNKIIASGFTYEFWWAVARYNYDGSPDTNFAINGILKPNLRGVITDLDLQNDGKIILSEYCGEYCRSSFAIHRILAD